MADFDRTAGKRIFHRGLVLSGILGVAIAAWGCGSPYYVEGQDELGDLPDSLRIQIEERGPATKKAAPTARDEGVLVRDLGDTEARPLPLEYSAENAYLLRRGDVVEVNVLFYPELETKSVVRPDGMITAPGVGDVVALGRRPAEVAADIEAYYSRLLRDPTTTVNVSSFGAREAYVFGEVNRPGAVPLEQRTTLTQAIAKTGSLTQYAKTSTVVLLRRKSENSAQAYRLDLRGVLDGKSLAADIVLQPDDVVYVPETYITSMERFIDQVFNGLRPIPDLYIRTWDAIHVDQRTAVRRSDVSSTNQSQ
ncbi:MAG: polysaccharide biosynthesis/export family protein [bacterium]